MRNVGPFWQVWVLSPSWLAGWLAKLLRASLLWRTQSSLFPRPLMLLFYQPLQSSLIRYRSDVETTHFLLEFALLYDFVWRGPIQWSFSFLSFFFFFFLFVYINLFFLVILSPISLSLSLSLGIHQLVRSLRLLDSMLIASWIARLAACLALCLPISPFTVSWIDSFYIYWKTK